MQVHFYTIALLPVPPSYVFHDIGTLGNFVRLCVQRQVTENEGFYTL